MSTGLSNSLEALFGKMESFITTKTVVGEPIHIGDVIVVPFVDVTFGIAAGVTDGTDEKSKDYSGGGGGLGGKITPTAVLVIIDGSVQLVSVKNEDSLKKLIDLVPGIVSKLNIGSWFGNKKKDSEKKHTKVEFEETRVSDTFDMDDEDEVIE